MIRLYYRNEVLGIDVPITDAEHIMLLMAIDADFRTVELASPNAEVFRRILSRMFIVQ